MGLRSPRKGMSLPAPSVLDESPAVLKTAGLSKRIRKEVIFEDISLSVPEGSVTAITGQNGAGKTTLAQILCGLAKQTRGHIGSLSPVNTEEELDMLLAHVLGDDGGGADD